MIFYILLILFMAIVAFIFGCVYYISFFIRHIDELMIKYDMCEDEVIKKYKKDVLHELKSKIAFDDE